MICSAYYATCIGDTWTFVGSLVRVSDLFLTCVAGIHFCSSADAVSFEDLLDDIVI